MTAPTDMDEAELDRLEGLYAAALLDEDDDYAAKEPDRIVFLFGLCKAWTRLIAAARSLPSERRAREAAERERSEAREAAIGFEHALMGTEIARLSAEAALAAERARVVALEEAARTEVAKIRAAIELAREDCIEAREISTDEDPWIKGNYDGEVSGLMAAIDIIDNNCARLDILSRRLDARTTGESND